MGRKRGAAKHGSFDGEEKQFNSLNDVKDAVGLGSSSAQPSGPSDQEFREALRAAADRSTSLANKGPSPRPVKLNCPKQQKKQPSQKNQREEDIDQILHSFRAAKTDGIAMEGNLSVTQTIFTTFKQTPFRILAVVLLLACLFALKSGEDQYHSMITSTHTLEVNPYELLGIPRTASRAEIRRAHRKLSLEWHPDKRENGCDEECHKTFRQINEAYKILSDEKRRTLYDQTQKVTDGSSNAFFSNLQSTEYLLTESAWESIVSASLEHRQLWTPPDVSGVWAFLIADPRSEWTESLIPLWTELASRFYGRISFMRVDSTEPLADKLLPVKLRITPAIMTLAPDGVPNVYDKMLHFQPRHLVTWLQEAVPNVMHRWTGSVSDLKDLLINKRNSPDGRLYVVLTSGRTPSTLHRAIALRTASLFNWIYVDTPDFADALHHLLPKIPKSVKGLILAPDAAKNESISLIQLPSSHWQLDKIDLRVNEEEELVNSAAAIAHRELAEALTDVARNNEISLFEENIPFLCRSKDDSVRTLCSLRVDPASPLTPKEMSKSERFLSNVKLQNLDDNEDFVEPDEYETGGPSDDDQARLIQHVRINSKPLGALGSVLTRIARTDEDTTYLDFASAHYMGGTDGQWKPLPANCARVSGKAAALSWIARRFATHYPCGPRWKLSHSEAFRYWWASHPLLASILPVSLVALIVAWPRRKVVAPGTEDEHQHSD